MLERMQGSRINDQRCHMPAYAQVTMAMLSILFITIETCIYIAKTKYYYYYYYYRHFVF